MHDLIIIGAGPAGLTAGLYAGRYKLNTLILEKAIVGGQIVLSMSIENFPGFPGGISTYELIERFKKQVDELGIAIEPSSVSEIIQNHQAGSLSYEIKVQGKSYQARTIIIAVGAKAQRLAVPGEERLIGRGVSYCGTCDGPFFKDKEIIVVGGGDRALEEAIFLTNYAKKVSLVHRRDSFRGSRILEEKAAMNPKINFVLDTIIEEIVGKDRVEAVKIKNLKSGSSFLVNCHGVFVFVGINPQTDFLKNQLAMDEKGFIISDENLKTSQDGIFACGDCRKKGLYQVINACGEGAAAAYSAQRYLL
jgi:thioredoxin reductase (NADPH)